MDGKQHHILNASSNLLGICFILITGLKALKLTDATFADEISAFAAFTFLCATTLSYLSIRARHNAKRYEKWADYSFLVGMFSLFAAVGVFYMDLF